jgi:1-aminocyclopropane-1-carboxylate deaminase/D-cysteine desulfhydrase-like pyridoxal-dependent ACC family enzyme
MSLLQIQRTQIERLTHVSRALGVEVWCKRDDQTHVAYGGNKPRKLAGILADALHVGATDVLTSGTIGSHHVLATAIHGKRAGLRVHAVVAPQSFTEHALQVAYQAQTEGVQYTRVPDKLLLPFATQWVRARLLLRGVKPFVIALGGSSVAGCAGYFQAFYELLEQIDAGAMDGQRPDLIVCPHGSGGTHAGILAAVRELGLSGQLKVVGVQVAAPWSLPRVRASLMAERVRARQTGRRPSLHSSLNLQDVYCTNDFFAGGYGVASADGDRATALFAQDQIELDPTYTAKTAAAIAAVARAHNAKRVLYWHTLSSVALPRVEQCASLRPELRAMLR